MSDPDPEDKGGDIDSPPHRIVEPGDPYAGPDLIDPRIDAPEEHNEVQPQDHVIESARWLHGLKQIAVDLAVAQLHFRYSLIDLLLTIYFSCLTFFKYVTAGCVPRCSRTRHTRGL